jgi:uncharacterized protein
MNMRTKLSESGNLTSNSLATSPAGALEPARLVTLADGRAGLRSGLTVQTALPAGEDAPIIDFIASSETLDRYGEIIVASGWRLENFRRNPVFQNAHQYGDVLFTLGRALLTEVRELGSPRRPVLFQRIEFAVEANPMARIAYGLYRGKFLNAVSVGFIPIRWENGSAEAGYRRKYLEQELLEVSAVGIPANPEALQLALRSGAVAKGDLVQVMEVLHERVRVAAQNPKFESPEIRNPKPEVLPSALR